MAKSVLNALIAIQVEQRRLDIYQPAGIEEWEGDERGKITLNDLMQMQSGLEWNENYGNRSDITLMLQHGIMQGLPCCSRMTESFVVNVYYRKDGYSTADLLHLTAIYLVYKYFIKH